MKNTALFLLLIFVLLLPQKLLCFSTLVAHPLKMSYTAMKYNAKAKKIDVTLRIFEDDLTAVIQKNYQYTPDLSASKTDKKTIAVVSKYLNECIQLKVGNKTYPLTYLSGIENGDVGLIYRLEINNIDLNKAKALDLSIKLLMSEFKEQTNIVFLEINSNSFNYKFTTNQANKRFEL